MWAGIWFPKVWQGVKRGQGCRGAGRAAGEGLVIEGEEEDGVWGGSVKAATCRLTRDSENVHPQRQHFSFCLFRQETALKGNGDNKRIYILRQHPGTLQIAMVTMGTQPTLQK